jgi:peptide/nickel transport system permease protein
MTAYIIRRLLLFPVVLIGATILAFTFMRALPGDVVGERLGPTNYLCEECRRRIEEDLGLDKPTFWDPSRPGSIVDSQYSHWLSNVVTGNFGVSITQNGVNITGQLKRRAILSLELAAVAMVMTVIIGIPVGLVAALWARKPPDYLVRFLSVLGLSVPNFWLATLVVFMPVVWWGVNLAPPFPTREQDFVGHYRGLLIPALVIAFGASAVVARYVRSTMFEVLTSDYVRTAKAKGLAARVVIYRHAFRNALIPVITVVGLQFGLLLGGAIVIENIFGIPGLGSWAAEAVGQRDYQVLLAVTVVTTTAFLIVSLTLDIVYAWADPRIHY